MTAEQRALLSALRAVPGVAAADLEDDGHPGGAGALRLRLVPGADEVAVAAAVNRVLRTRFGLVVDVDRVQVLDDPDDLDLGTELLGGAVGEPVGQADDGTGPGGADRDTSPRWLGLAAADEDETADDAADDVADDDRSIRLADQAAGDQDDTGRSAEEPETTSGARVRALRVGAVRVLPAAASDAAPRAEPASGSEAWPAPSEPWPAHGTDSAEDEASRRPHAGTGLRLALRRVQLRTEGLVSTAAVTLGLGEGSWTGEGEAAATPTAVQRAVAVATARAVEAAIGQVARVEVEHVDVPVAGRERTALVVVSVVTGAGAERLSGASVVRQDVRQAVVRATLAAVNRRVEGWLPAGRVAG
ncbi:MAG TPA: hypothetical protein VFS29_11975 [Motilibacteraceae bacterium]|nr:hypothetical protein [Motilibacteraceae bacterium]